MVIHLFYEIRSLQCDEKSNELIFLHDNLLVTFIFSSVHVLSDNVTKIFPLCFLFNVLLSLICL